MRGQRRFDAGRVPSALPRPAMEGTQVSRRHPQRPRCRWQSCAPARPAPRRLGHDVQRSPARCIAARSARPHGASPAVKPKFDTFPSSTRPPALPVSRRINDLALPDGLFSQLACSGTRSAFTP
jgi:hypothetical protein